MLAKAWIEKQVFSAPLAELKQALGRKRLRLSRPQLLEYVMALIEQHQSMRHFRAIYQGKGAALTYAGFMKGMGLAAPVLAWLEKKLREEKRIGFDDLTIVDSSLLPAIEEPSITRRHWERGRATLRPREEGGKRRICGEKLLAMLNSQGQLVFSRLLPSINSPDDNVLKQPYTWARKGLRQGVVLMDRGFGNNAVKAGFAHLRKALPGFTATPLYPPRKSQKWQLSPTERQLYKKRWQIEEAFRQLKDPQGPFRLILKGVRRPALRAAKVAIATLAWNFSHS